MQLLRPGCFPLERPASKQRLTRKKDLRRHATSMPACSSSPLTTSVSESAVPRVEPKVTRAAARHFEDWEGGRSALGGHLLLHAGLHHQGRKNPNEGTIDGGGPVVDSTFAHHAELFSVQHDIGSIKRQPRSLPTSWQYRLRHQVRPTCPMTIYVQSI